MEEKVLVKGVFGGKFLVVLLYILAIIFAILFITADEDFIPLGILCGIILSLFAVILNKILKERELIVTNKRVIARGAFSFRTDFPIEKVTSVSTRWFGGIGCGTPSLKIMFHFCNNKQEIFDTIASETLKRDSAFLDK